MRVGRGFSYLGSALRVALGAGAVLGGSYFFSRIKERQSVEARLDRLEQMVEELADTQAKETRGE